MREDQSAAARTRGKKTFLGTIDHGTLKELETP